MGSRIKEDERHEKMIRGLSKLEHNRRCINCGAVGPQYVCTNFSTFVCNNCSGIHREFTHRVKSISMAKFSAAEVAALQAGGNQHAKELYLQERDLKMYPLPDSSYPEKVRDFIKAVYVDKRFSADRPPQRSRQGERDISIHEKSDSCPGSNSGSSTATENRFEDRRHSNPRVSQGSDGSRFEDWSFEDRASSFEDKSPGKYEANRGRYNKNDQDRWVEDRFANEGLKNPGGLSSDRSKFDCRQLSDRDRHSDDRFSGDAQNSWRSRDRPPNHRSYGIESSPPVLSVRDILGEDVPKLRIEDNGHANTRLKSSASLGSSAGPHREIPTQRSASFGNGGTTTGNLAGLTTGTTSLFKRANSDSLIDFSVEPGPPATVQTDPPVATSLQSTAGNSNPGWASFDAFSSLTPKAELFPPVNWHPDFQQWSRDSSTGLPDQTTQMPVELGVHPPQAHSFVQIQDSQNMSNLDIQRQATSQSQDHFTPSFAQPGFVSTGIHKVLNFPLGGSQCGSLGLEVGLHGPGEQPRKSKNPFDLPEDISPTSTNFPRMATLQAYLPNLPLEPLSSLAMNSARQQYSYVGSYLPPAYDPVTYPGGSGSNLLSLNPMPPLQHQPMIQAEKSDNMVVYQAGPSTYVPAYEFSGPNTLQVSQKSKYGGNPFA